MYEVREEEGRHGTEGQVRWQLNTDMACVFSSSCGTNTLADVSDLSQVGEGRGLTYSKHHPPQILFTKMKAQVIPFSGGFDPVMQCHSPASGKKTRFKWSLPRRRADIVGLVTVIESSVTACGSAPLCDWQDNQEQALCVIPVVTSIKEEERLIQTCTKVRQRRW